MKCLGAFLFGTINYGPTGSQSGCIETVGVSRWMSTEHLINANFILNVTRAPLVKDYSYLALDEPGRNAFRRLERELCELDPEDERRSLGRFGKSTQRCLK